jgi:hypothetical protein
MVTEDGNVERVEFTTDRTTKWTEEQYSRHRNSPIMELISNEEAE